MPIRTRDYLSQFHPRIFPSLRLVAITKVIRRPRPIKHDKLPKLVFTFQHMSQSRAQRRYSGTHRHENKIPPFHFVEFEPVSGDPNQLNLIANFHVVDNTTRTRFLFHKHFHLRVVRRARKRKVSRLFARNSQYGDLAGREINVFGRTQIERARDPRLVPDGCNYERLHRRSDDDTAKPAGKFKLSSVTVLQSAGIMSYYRLAITLLIVLCAMPIVQAQSGRRKTQPAPAAPVPTPTPEPTPIPKKEEKTDLLFFIGADRFSSYGSYPFSYYDAVLKGCADRLRAGSSASVDITDKDLSRGEAIKKAKSEARSYVVLLTLKFDTLARSYDDLILEFVVFTPGSAKVVITGRSYQNANRKGPIIVGPTGRGSGLYREQLLQQAGEDAGTRILKAMNLNTPVMR